MGRIDLAGRAALVTGAGTRLGAAIARELAAAGADIVIHYARSEEGAKAVAADVEARGRRAALVQADLYERAAIARLAESARAAFGRIDVLVHNAANFERVPPSELSVDAWDRAMALNVTAPYLLTIALAGELRRTRGAVVAITCLSAARPLASYVPYSASKGALENLTKGLALALAPDVRVNAVAPGAALPPDDYDEATRAKLAASVPLGRIGEAADVARAVVFLCENDYVSGHTIVVDGARSLAPTSTVA